MSTTHPGAGIRGIGFKKGTEITNRMVVALAPGAQRRMAPAEVEPVTVVLAQFSMTPRAGERVVEARAHERRGRARIGNVGLPGEALELLATAGGDELTQLFVVIGKELERRARRELLSHVDERGLGRQQEHGRGDEIALGPSEALETDTELAAHPAARAVRADQMAPLQHLPSTRPLGHDFHPVAQVRRFHERPGKTAFGMGEVAEPLEDRLVGPASLVELDENGRTKSHRWFQISGQDATGAQTGTVEVVEFTDANPRWRTVGNILQPLSTTKAVLLPDGKVLITGGNNSIAGGCFCDPLATAELYDPTTGTFTPAGEMTKVRSAHTATLLNNGKVLIAGFIPGIVGGLVYMGGGTPVQEACGFHDTVVKTNATPAVREKLTCVGANPLTMSPEEFTKFIRADIDKWGKLAKSAGIVIER